MITAGQGGQYRLGGADHSSDHGNYRISISLGPQQGNTYSPRPSFVPGAGTALPSFIPQPRLKEANEHRIGTSILQEGGPHSFIQRPFCEILRIYQRPSLQSVSIHTTPLLLALPAAAHKLSKPSSTFSHCARLKGRLAGEVEKSCVCLNMSLKKQGGELVKCRPV